jgi:hypothetical protein
MLHLKLCPLYVGYFTVCWLIVINFMSFALCYVVISLLCFLLFVLCLFSSFVCVAILGFLCFCIVCVLFLLMYIVFSFQNL